MRFKNYKNKYTNDNVIHSIEDVIGMPFGDVVNREPELESQYRQIGLPTDAELNSSPNAVYVNAYTRDDGTKVRAHWRSKPEGRVNGVNSNPIPEQIQSGVNMQSYNNGILGDLNNNASILNYNDETGINNIDVQTALAPLLFPMILSQLLTGQNAQPKQNIPTGYASDIYTNSSNYLDNETDKPVYTENGIFNEDKIDYKFIGNKSTTSNNPDMPIYPENGVIKGGISNDYNQENNDKTIGDKFKEWLFTNVVTEKILPMASHSVKDGMNDMEVAKQNPHATVYSSINDLEDKSLTEKFKKLEADENIKGVVYDSKSKEAQKISKSKELNDYLNEVISNGGVPQKDTFEFVKSGNIFSSNNDLHYSLQNVTVHDPKISDDGEKFTCKIIDVSDFKERPKTFQNIPNNWGYNMQEKGQYKNYFEVIEIEVKLTDEQKEVLKKRKRY